MFWRNPYKIVSSSEWSIKICDRRKQQSVRFRNNGAPGNTQGQLMNYLVTTTLRERPASLALASAIFILCFHATWKSLNNCCCMYRCVIVFKHMNTEAVELSDQHSQIISFGIIR
jgi:hypothetical protein